MTIAQSSNRPVTVSSMSSLDSLIDAALDNKTNTLSVEDESQMPAAERNVVSSSTLSSIGKSPPLNSTEAPANGVSSANAATISSSSAPTGMMLTAPVAIAPSPAVAPTPAPAAPNNNTVAEFLFQLSKMLTDDNKEIIEWNNGQINVHDPYRLQSEVLNNYFRHSKFASFQRQLNYFGFRKLAGKGKMAPCSYVNEATTADIRSLLLIKRKAGPSIPREKDATKKRARSDTASAPASAGTSASSGQVNPVLAGILQRNSGVSTKKGSKVPAKSKGTQAKVNTSSSQQELARAAVGKGVRHGFMPSVATSAGSATEALASASMFFPDPPNLGLPDIQDSLSELTNNYRNSLQAANEPQANESTKSSEEGENQSNDPSFQMYNFLSRDSSLVDLAMLVPTANGAEASSDQNSAASVEPTPVNEMRASSMPFLDFGIEPPDDKDESG